SAGKTGTTDNYADAWFCGFTPSLEATIWIGYPRGEIPMLSVHGIEVSGPTFPATIWKLFMEPAQKYAPFPKAFPVATHAPIWRSRSLQYAMSGGFYSSGALAHLSPPSPAWLPASAHPPQRVLHPFSLTLKPP